MPVRTSTLPLVNGGTDVYLILGDPVEQVRAPETFNHLFARFGINAVLVPALVAPTDLAAFVKAAFLVKNIKGIWATMPHKEALVGLLDRCSELGRIAGAVNAVRRNANGQLEGGLFDGEGFLSSLSYFSLSHVGKRVLIIGAGGAAAAIGASLALDRGAGSAAKLAFYNPCVSKAQVLAQRISQATGCAANAVLSNDPVGFDLVINASPLGMNKTDPLPCDVSRINANAAAVDVVMKNQPTPWVLNARARGLTAQPGFEMLIQQTHLYLDFFGFADAAKEVRNDAVFLREKIYPPKLRGEIFR